MVLGHYNALWLLFLVPLVLVPACVWCFWRKTAMLKILASTEMLHKINISVSLKKQVLKAIMLVCAFVSVVIALTEPKWNPRPQQIKRAGRDIVILLDTSRSMLAEDIKPNRLERSKIAIADLLAKLQGDRLAIVTFSGNATVRCPLTQDYAFVRTTLADITTETNAMGGTLIGDAVRKAATTVFDQKNRQYKDIILITDGEEHQGYESFPEQAAKDAAQEGIRIIAIGLGDETEGARIPITGPDGKTTFLTYKGKEVWTKLAADKLREIVFPSGGKFLAVRPGETFSLDEIYSDFIASAEKRELESSTMTQYDERFQIFLALAIGLIICEALISERKKA